MKEKTGLWVQTPPAIFPPILGLFGLGLSWRQATMVFSVPAAIGEVILGGVTLLFLFAVFAYFAKIIRRPGAMLDDLRIMPGRAGVFAASMAAMLFATTLMPYSSCLAAGVLLSCIVVHALNSGLVIKELSKVDIAARRINPVWHLTFVGYIVAPLAMVPLGWITFSEIIFVLTLPMAITIWAGHAFMLVRTGIPAPLRPLLVIHLAPVCLFGITSVLLGFTQLAFLFAWIAFFGILVLLIRVRYLIAAGFSPQWSAFTLPIAAFSNLMMLLAVYGGPYRYLGGIALVAGTIIIPVISYKIMKMWASGTLGPKTNASRI